MNELLEKIEEIELNNELKEYDNGTCYDLYTIPYVESCTDNLTKRKYQYDEETVKNAVRYFKELDKRKKINPNTTESEYVYQFSQVEKILQGIKALNLTRKISYRVIKAETKICYEINFDEILQKTKPLKF